MVDECMQVDPDTLRLWCDVAGIDPEDRNRALDVVVAGNWLLRRKHYGLLYLLVTDIISCIPPELCLLALSQLVERLTDRLLDAPDIEP